MPPPYLHSLQVGSLKLESNILCAPLAGITNEPYRKLLDTYHPALLFCEMVSATAIMYEDKKTFSLLEGMQKHASPVGVQLFGASPKQVAQAAKWIEKEYAPALIDINMACPVRKVIRKNGGASLLKDEDLAVSLVQACVDLLSTPLSVKLRLGFGKGDTSVLSLAPKLEEAGAAMLTVHGRTAAQMYSGSSNVAAVQKLAEKLTIPVLYSGDMLNVEKVRAALEGSALSGVMLARGLFGSPWLIEDLFLGEEKERSLQERGAVVLRQYRYFVEALGEAVACSEMKKHLGWYSKGLKNGKEFRKEAMQCQSVSDHYRNIVDFFKLSDSSSLLQGEES